MPRKSADPPATPPAEPYRRRPRKGDPPPPGLTEAEVEHLKTRRATGPGAKLAGSTRNRQKMPRSTMSHWPIGHPRRPKVYDPVYAPRATSLARAGFTEAEIAEHFGVDTDTLARWKNEHAEFYGALQEGQTLCDVGVVDTLYGRAMGMRVDAVKIFLPPGAEKPVYAPYRDYIPPDVGAIKYILNNRRGRDWADKREVAVTGTIEHRLEAMTPEQRRARLIELHAKATEVLEGEVIEGEAVEVPDER